jgi:hypothetical protein
MGANERVLGDLFSILMIPQELVHHGVDAVPVTRDHFVEGGLISALEAVNQETIEGNFLGFGRHTFCLALMRVVLKCSHELRPKNTSLGT